MRNRFGIAMAGLVLGMAVQANAGILSLHMADDGDGAVICNVVDQTFGTPAPETTVNIVGDQYWWPGHVVGDIWTDGLDPTLKINNSIDNDATVLPLVWTDYHVNIRLNKPFTVSNVSIANAGWSITHADATAVAIGGGYYQATVDYAGIPINNGGTIDFGYWVSFTGTAQFCQELIPTPEPATMSLLALGGVALLKRRRRV